MRILSIETSCDDTSIALVDITPDLRTSDVHKLRTMPKIEVLASIVSSQTAIHRHWGGVVPNLAKREHIKNLPKIFKTLVASRYWLIPDLIAVTAGPGLEPALWTGIEFAKKLSEKTKVPLVGANHLEGHLYSVLLSANRKAQIAFPAIVLLVSGGHTMLLLMKDLLHWKKLGETRDDAVGESFDKVARMMNLPYPGGPEVEKLAARGNPKAVQFPRPMLKENNYDFSFSGLKTSVLYYLKATSDWPLATGKEKRRVTKKPSLVASRYTLVADICASFQSAAIDVLTTKTIRAARNFGAKSVILCGGVAANNALRKSLGDASKIADAEFYAPPFEYNTDNAAMIAVAAYFAKMRKKKYKLEADSTLTL